MYILSGDLPFLFFKLGFLCELGSSPCLVSALTPGCTQGSLLGILGKLYVILEIGTRVLHMQGRHTTPCACALALGFILEMSPFLGMLLVNVSPSAWFHIVFSQLFCCLVFPAVLLAVSPVLLCFCYQSIMILQPLSQVPSIQAPSSSELNSIDHGPGLFPLGIGV